MEGMRVYKRMGKKNEIARDEIAGAADIYNEFFGRLPSKLHSIKFKGGERILIPLGEAISIRYRAMKHEDDESKFYEHAFGDGTALFWDAVNNALIIIGDLEITKAGIDG